MSRPAEENVLAGAQATPAAVVTLLVQLCLRAGNRLICTYALYYRLYHGCPTGQRSMNLREIFELARKARLTSVGLVVLTSPGILKYVRVHDYLAVLKPRLKVISHNTLSV